MHLKEYVRQQLEEALGPVNRWYCSEHYGREVTDPNLLLEYYIKNGGAEHFARIQASQCFDGRWMWAVHGAPVLAAG